MSSTDLIPVPVTGEAINLTAGTDDLAYWVDRLQDIERQAKEARSMVGEELLRRLDHDACWTARVEGFEITAPSPAPTVEYDVDKLRATLDELVDDGYIGQGAAQAAVKVETSYKPVVAKLNALKKVAPEVARRIEECGTEVEKRRYVRVRPLRNAA